MAVKTAVRHPKPALRGARFVVRHRRGLLGVVRGAQRTRNASPLLAQLSSGDVRGELASSAGALWAALSRSQKVGARKALTDRRVGKHVAAIGSHLTTAVQPSRKQRSHRSRNIAIGAIVVGVALAAMNRRSNDEEI